MSAHILYNSYRKSYGMLHPTQLAEWPWINFVL